MKVANELDVIFETACKFPKIGKAVNDKTSEMIVKVTELRFYSSQICDKEYQTVTEASGKGKLILATISVASCMPALSSLSTNVKCNGTYT